MQLLADKLNAERGGDLVFSEVGFAVASGGAIVVTGANGSGKSTLLRVICGLLPATGGSVTLQPASDQWPTVASACHYLGHENGLKPALTVEENLRFWRGFEGEPALEVEDALEQVGLAGVRHLPFGTLSTGQRRRVALSRLLVTFRPIWLLDEPTAGLDARSERQFSGLMRAHLDRGGMIVAATHVPLGLEGAAEMVMGVR